MSDTKRISLSVPSGLADDLDYISSRLGVSRSGFVTQLLIGADLGRLRSLLSAVPESATEADARRFRGESREFIREQLERISALQGGLFDDSEG